MALAAGPTHATHIVGGEMYYDHLGGDQYQVTIKLYRDCSAITGYDNPIQVGVYSGLGTYLWTTPITFPGAQLVPIDLDNPCLSLPPEACIEVAVYTQTVTLPPTPSGYVLSYQRCCRTGIIENLPDPGSLGITLMCTVPGTDVTDENSSPRFNELPPVALCINEPLVFDHSATDLDGDQLEYVLCTPFNGGTQATPTPIPGPGTAPPYQLIPWGLGYSETYPIDSDPAISIDPVSGSLTLTPSQLGVYNVGVCVREYRNGVLLSETRRDFLFEVVACNASVAAGLLPQQPTQVCAGLSMNFTNLSQGASNYHWDFGDPNMVTDTSNIYNPSWTYAQPGSYTVSIIANPGLVCADTASTVFNVYNSPDPYFEVPEPTCGPSTSTLVALGENFGPGANVFWDLGPGVVPSSALGHQVDASFSVGVHVVTVNVIENGCAGDFTANVIAYPVPTASFTVDPLPPQLAGTVVTLTDQSTGNGGVIVDREWTNGYVQLLGGSQAIWDNTLPGQYNLSLVVITSDGCSDTTYVSYEIYAGEIEIPNVFTPNSDGLNDFFVIENGQYLDNSLIIYNRWGMVVYETVNYRNTWRGTDLPDGTYYYVFRLAKGGEYAGHVTLLR